ncbi:nucleolar and coiled-body phosphoprotein 1-like [Daphnia pulex]|uniref:nucleolar and coiled-body phosphoprotein 1-like n=1 Tax=Daphnia pulex TaxID=6669 RepID=UPI001EDEB41E|nr:nucleolar and coiled-body phosphoprotein 1-like [Daphnia pulex]
MLPGLHNTFALPKKNAGKSQKVNKGKTSPEVEDDVKTAPVEKKTPETVETNEAAAPAPVAETKEKRGRGKKAQPPVAKSEEMSSSPKVNPEPVEETAQEKDVQVWVFKVVAEPKSKPGPKSKTGPKSKMKTKPTEAESETTQVVEPEVVEKKGRGKRGNQVLDTAPPTVTEVVTDQPEVQAPPVVAAATEVSPAPKESENLVTNEPDTKEKRGRGRQASSKDGAKKAAKASEEPLPNDETESPLPASPVAETKEKRGRGPQAKAQAEAPVEETTEAVEVVPAKRGRGKKAAAPAASKADAEEEAVEEVKETKPKGKKGAAAAKKHVEEEEKPAVPEEPAASKVDAEEEAVEERGRRKKATPLAKVAADEEAEAVEEVKETKAKGKKGPAAKKQAEEKVAAVPEAAEKPQKTTKRGKAAVATPDESEASPTKKPKGAPLETEGVRKSSRTQVVKTYADESSESLDQPASKKRGGRKKAAANGMDGVAEEAEDTNKFAS